MIVYFVNRKFEILGQASTGLPSGLAVSKDEKIDDVETGVSSFECKIHYDQSTRLAVEEWATAGNYLLRSEGDECEFFTIIDSESDTDSQTVYIYCEDAGLDLLNEVVDDYEADKAYTISQYIDMFAYDSGFRMGTNEAASLSKKLSFEEQTVTARIVDIAKQFGDYEVSYSFKVKGMKITNKYINIWKKRGQELGAQLRLNKEIDSIITSKSVANLATALRCTGGTPEGAEDPITLRGYKYDDGDFYVDGDTLKSRKALAKWSRYLWVDEPNQKEGHEGHIVKLFNYDTPTQATLCSEAVKELKAICDVEVNYEVEIAYLPDDIRIGDRVNIVDEAGEIYLSTRLLQLKTSVANQTKKAVLGEHIIKNSGIHQKVIDLAKQFATTAKSAARALSFAKTAQEAATEAKTQANTALADAVKAQQAATEAATAAQTATQSAADANAKADGAQAAVDNVEKEIESLNTTIDNAQQAADNAHQAATTAQAKADEAAQAAAQAKADAAEANASVAIANEKATTATTKAEAAQSTAEAAKADADTAKATADAAKLDAEKAQEDIASLGDQLTTVTQTMEVDYARKTDLTEATASLQTQISQNAAEISSTASKVQTIDETANNAAEQAQAAQTTAGAAQAKADQAAEDAQAAQTAANEAAQAAQNAQSEADTAKAAAATAQEVADKAEADLEAAKADLATVSGRVDATEEEIASAQQAVTAAQEAADKANADAEAAANKATAAQQTADTAVTNAANAQTKANEAIQTAANAQALANQAIGDASAAQQAADQAAAQAAQAQQTADTAKTNATNAQNKADAAATAAANAQKAADDADAKAAQAAADLATAEQNLEEVRAKADATEEEVRAAQEAVETAQAAADQAKTDAQAAQSTADEAKANATAAQTAANTAKTAADKAQADAEAAKKAADDAQDAVDALAVRVTTAETSITQNAEQIALMATKTEVAETLGGYSTKEETAAAIEIAADEITSTVSKSYEMTASRGEQLVTNGNGLLGDNTNFSQAIFDGAVANNSPGSFTKIVSTVHERGVFTDEFIPVNADNRYTLRFDAKSRNGLARMYSMLVCYDVDKQQIMAADHSWVAGTLTTLSQDLKNGDTVVHLTDVSAWQRKLYAKYVSFWNYTNSFGYTYPAETYTKNRATIQHTSSTPNEGAIDYANNTITLQSAWTGGTVAAGTQVSQGSDGSGYSYIATIYTQIPTNWTSYEGSMQGVDYSGSTAKKDFPPGTAYCKVGFMPNYDVVDDQIWLTNITLMDTTADNDLSGRLTSAETRITNAETSITQTNSKIALCATKTEVTEAVNGIEIGGRNLLLSSGNEVANNLYCVNTYDPSTPLVAGEEYTVSLCVTPAEGVTHFAVFVSGGWCVLAYIHPDGTEKQILSKTFVAKYATDRTPADNATFGQIQFYRFPNDGTVTEDSTIHWVKIEKGNKATDWTPAPEDMATGKDVEGLGEEVKAVSESVAAVDIKADAIDSSVKSIKTSTEESIGALNDNLNTLTNEVATKMTAEAVEVQIKSAMENGTSKVVTETGFTFDEEGLTVEKTGSEMKTQITEDGMTVYQNGNATLTANNKGVDAKNLHATTYLIVGANSRFEDYGEGRTGCFWIGG